MAPGEKAPFGAPQKAEERASSTSYSSYYKLFSPDNMQFSIYGKQYPERFADGRMRKKCYLFRSIVVAGIAETSACFPIIAQTLHTPPLPSAVGSRRGMGPGRDLNLQ